MTILVDSVEYKCWHEVGHATVCLHLGGDVDCIEFLDGDARGQARTRCCEIPPEVAKSVACGGFAAEVYLFQNGYATQATGDKRAIDQIPFDSAAIDCLEFLGRALETYDGLTDAETRDFVIHAVGSDCRGGVIPIIAQHYLRMQEVVRELCNLKRIEGRRIRELLGL